MEASPNNKTEVMVPAYIDEVWIENFNRQYKSGLIVTLESEDWLVQPRGVIGSAYYKLVDEQGPAGSWSQRIEGTLWDVSITDTPQYVDTTVAPVIALMDAISIGHDGKETKLNTSDSDYGLILVRLDRLNGSILIEPGQDT